MARGHFYWYQLLVRAEQQREQSKRTNQPTNLVQCLTIAIVFELIYS
jgi:hypothetical protein